MELFAADMNIPITHCTPLFFFIGKSELSAAKRNVSKNIKRKRWQEKNPVGVSDELKYSKTVHIFCVCPNFTLSCHFN